MKIILGLLMVCCLAVGQGKQTIDESGKISSYTLVDEVIRALLENLKKDIAELRIPDIDETYESEFLNASFSAKKTTHKNLENFEIVHLRSTLVPLKISNLTLHWKNVQGSTHYDFDMKADLQDNKETRYFGKGQASISLDDLTFTIGANLEQKNGAFQIKHAGLFGFNLRLGAAKVELGSLMNSEELGTAVGQLIGEMLPTIIDESKDFLFNLLRDDIIKVINKALRTKTVNGESYEFDEELQELESF